MIGICYDPCQRALILRKQRGSSIPGKRDLNMDTHNSDGLLDDIHSDDPDRQVAALLVLIEHHIYSAISEILPLLSSTDTTVRLVSAEALGKLGKAERERVGPALLPLLDDNEALVRSETIEALGALTYQEAIDSLKRLLHQDPDWMVRASAAEVLGDFEDASLLADLEQALVEDEVQIVQAYAALSIGLLAPPTHIPKLEAYLTAMGDCVNVRNELLGALYRLGSPRSLQKIINLLETTDQDSAERLLSVVEDFIKRRIPPSLQADAPQLRKALLLLAQRFPIKSRYVEEILDGLTKLGGNST